MSWRENYDRRMWSLANSSGWPWRRKKKEEQDWRMMQLPNGSGWHWIRLRKKSKTGEDGSYHTAQVGSGKEEEQKKE